MAETEIRTDVAALTVQLLSAYLANNSVASEDLASLIRTTRAALVEDTAPVVPAREARTYTPAVSVRKSLASTDHIISLIDGKPYKTLKRHLSANGMTPDEYRDRYGLPPSYPMVAPSFTARRREIAERIGLGNRRAVDAAAAARSDETPESISAVANAEAPAKAPRGRPAGKRAGAKGSTAAAPVPKARGRKPKSSADAGSSAAVTNANPVEVADGPTAASEAETITTEASPALAKTSRRSAMKGTKATGKSAAKKVAAGPSALGKPAEGVTDAVTRGEESAAAAKHRRKLGSFGEGAGQSDDTTPSAADMNASKDVDGIDGASDAAEAATVAAKKPAAKKRMARTPKSTASKSTADDAAGQ